MSMIYIYAKTAETHKDKHLYSFSFCDVGEIDNISPWNYSSYEEMAYCAFKRAVEKQMKKFSFTIMTEVTLDGGTDYGFVDPLTELKIRVYNHLVDTGKTLEAISEELSQSGESFTVNRIRELLNPVSNSAEMMKIAVKALEYIISFYGLPIKFIDRMTVYHDQICIQNRDHKVRGFQSPFPYFGFYQGH